jgi:hypothetical protein
MTLESTLREKLSEWQAPPGRQELRTTAEGWSAAVTADRTDVVGAVVWELNLQREGSAPVAVRPWANEVARRVSGLMEPLVVVEVDATVDQAQLRSQRPLQREGSGFYYELLLSGLGSASLKRYQTAAGSSGREQTAFTLTHEALAKLAGDIASAA